MSVTVKLQDVRLAFSDIFTAKKFPGSDGPANFSATFLLPPEHPGNKQIEEAIEEVAKATWPDDRDDKLEEYRSNPQKFCYGTGSKGAKKKYQGFPGNMWISAKNQSRPTVVDRDTTPLTQEDGKPYSGCYVNAILDIWAQKGQYAGIRASLKGVQFHKDGDAFSGATVAAADDFDDLSDGADAPNVSSKYA